MDDSTFIQFYDNDHHHHIMSKLLYVNFSIMITMYNYEVILFIVLKIGVMFFFFLFQIPQEGPLARIPSIKLRLC